MKTPKLAEHPGMDGAPGYAFVVNKLSLKDLAKTAFARIPGIGAGDEDEITTQHV